jgi:hypothetical protein
MLGMRFGIGLDPTYAEGLACPKVGMTETQVFQIRGRIKENNWGNHS